MTEVPYHHNHALVNSCPWQFEGPAVARLQDCPEESQWAGHRLSGQQQIGSFPGI